MDDIRSYYCTVRLILASASPRRAELLRSAGYTFDVVVADVDESIRAGESPAIYVRRVAADKSFRVAADLRVGGHTGPPPQELVILGADTTVVVDGEILGKPRDDEDGCAMLRRLSGKAHQVLTGVSLRQGAYEVGRVEITAVVFRELTEEDITWYARSGEGRDKAGGYAIQEHTDLIIADYQGSFSNIVGLPLETTKHILTRCGLLP